jgi:hypothetical protein
MYIFVCIDEYKHINTKHMNKYIFILYNIYMYVYIHTGGGGGLAPNTKGAALADRVVFSDPESSDLCENDGALADSVPIRDRG